MSGTGPKVAIGLEDLARPVIEQKVKMQEMRAAEAKEAPKREREQKAEMRRARTTTRDAFQRPASAPRVSMAALRYEKKEDEEREKSLVIQKILHLVQQHSLELAHKPSMRLSLAENRAILYEAESLLALKRGRDVVQEGMRYLTLTIQKLCASNSPITPLRFLHAEGPPSLVEAVMSGPDWGDIIQEITLEYARFFKDVGPLTRYAFSIVAALSITQAIGADPKARAAFEALQKNLEEGRERGGLGLHGESQVEATEARRLAALEREYGDL